MTKKARSDSGVSEAGVSRAATRRKREKEQRRQDILRAAEVVFAAKPFRSVSLDEVAKVAEYAKGTIYLYFKNKEAVYSALFEQKVEEMLRTTRVAVDAAGNFPARLDALVRTQLDFTEKNAWFFQIFTQERMEVGNELKGETWTTVHALYAEFVAYVCAFVAAGQKEKILRKGDTQRYALALLGCLNFTSRSWLEQKSTASLVDEADFIIGFFLSGAGHPAK